MALYNSKNNNLDTINIKHQHVNYKELIIELENIQKEMKINDIYLYSYIKMIYTSLNLQYAQFTQFAQFAQ